MTNKRYNPRGFTLIELVVTIAVIAIMAALTVPNLHNFLRSNRMTSQINSFVSALQIAKSEAVKRGYNVVLCASTDQQNCNTTQWEKGWLIFADDPSLNNNKPFTFAAPTSPTTSSEILRVGGQLSGNDTLRDNLSASGTNTTGAIIYQPSGTAVVTANTATSTGNTFRLCDPNPTGQTQRALAINVRTSGVIALAGDPDGDGVVNNYNNVNISCP